MAIDCWNTVEIGWTKPADATLELVPQKNARLSNDKALHALRQALSPSHLQKFETVNLLKKRGKPWKLLVFWPHSVFRQNHLCVKML
jgi:hypothetical protein